MRKILCDRCGQEIPLNSKIGYVAVNWRAPSDGSLMYENRYEGYDFCEQCMEDIIAVADSICTHSEVIEEKKETPEELARRFVNAMKEVSAPESTEPKEADSGSETDVEPDIQGAVEKTVKSTKAAVEAWKDMAQSADAAAEGVQAMAAEARQTAPLEFPEDQEEPVGRLADNPPPKRFVNLRELRELVKAGKKPKEIAEHFGISVASFYNYRKRAEAMWNAGKL